MRRSKTARRQTLRAAAGLGLLLAGAATATAGEQPPGAAASTAAVTTGSAHTTTESAMPGPSPALLEARARTAALAENLRARALAAGVSAATYEAARAFMDPDPEVVDRERSQPEFERTTGAYVEALARAERVAVGRARLQDIGPTLAAIETRFGVDRHMVLAIWGVETNYGANRGERHVIRSLATLAALEPRRQAFWTEQLIAALRILDARDIALSDMLGSWAGAMGHTQFMPTSFQRFAVDFDGDRRRDIWTSIPDALASTANYLARHGWQRGERWGVEVRLPAGFDYALTAPGAGKPREVWHLLGLKQADGAALPALAGDLEILLPAGAAGPAFLTGAGFKAILAYNPATAYALAVGLLADRIAGAGEIAQAWPADQRALSRSEREALQAALAALGHDVGGIDGVLGRGTRRAIRAFQRSAGLIEDGHPDAALLQRVQQAADRR